MTPMTRGRLARLSGELYVSHGVPLRSHRDPQESTMVGLKFNNGSSRVIGCAIEVHRGLGPGLLESSYEQCLAHELTLAGVAFKVLEDIPVLYKWGQVGLGLSVMRSKPLQAHCLRGTRCDLSGTPCETTASPLHPKSTFALYALVQRTNKTSSQIHSYQ